jgi:hypothetical protein
MVSMLESLEAQMNKQHTPERKAKYFGAIEFLRDQISMDCNPRIIDGIIEANRELSHVQNASESKISEQ